MSDVTVKPAFQSAAVDTGVPGQLGPAEWNAARLFSGGNDGEVAVRDSTATTGASWGVRSERLHVETTSTSTLANTTETDLWTYTLPAGKLNVNGRGLRITVWGVSAANANVKTTRLYFGATALTRTPGNASVWRYAVDVIRTGAATQVLSGWSSVDASLSTSSTSPTADTTAAITIRLTGQNGTASAGDIVFRGALVDLL